MGLPLVIMNLGRIPFVFRLELSVRVTYRNDAEGMNCLRKFQCGFHYCGTLLVRGCCYKIFTRMTGRIAFYDDFLEIQKLVTGLLLYL